MRLALILILALSVNAHSFNLDDFGNVVEGALIDTAIERARMERCTSMNYHLVPIEWVTAIEVEVDPDSPLTRVRWLDVHGCFSETLQHHLPDIGEVVVTKAVCVQPIPQSDKREFVKQVREKLSTPDCEEI